MKKLNKNRVQLLRELTKLHKRIRGLEKMGIQWELSEKELRGTNAFLRNIIESSSYISIISTDIKGNIVYWNKGAENIFGYKAEEIVGRYKIDKLYARDADTKKLTWEIRSKILHKKRGINFTIKELTKNGREIWVNLTLTPRFDDKRRVIGTLGIGEDITERKHAESELQESLKKLRKALEGVVHAMALAIEIRDPYTAGHQRRVACLSRAIAKEMRLPEPEIEGLYMAAVIHDLGKIYVPAEILTKPGKLSEIEFALIKNHCQVGYEILKDMDFPWPIAQIIYQHHERLNGSGYPQGLKGKNILLESMIVGVADVVETMATFRPYRPALGLDKALDEISKHKGTLYDPFVVDECIRLFKKKGFKFIE